MVLYLHCVYALVTCREASLHFSFRLLKCRLVGDGNEFHVCVFNPFTSVFDFMNSVF